MAKDCQPTAAIITSASEASGSLPNHPNPDGLEERAERPSLSISSEAIAAARTEESTADTEV